MIIGITGGSASGKTHVAKSIEQYFQQNKINILLLSQDSFYKGLTETDNITEHNFDHPDAINFNEMIECISKLKNNQCAQIPIYSFINHTREGSKNVDPCDIIIVEGILIFTDERLRDLFDIKIFVEASAETRLMRRIRRDQEDRGRSLESINQQYMKFVRPSYENIVKPTRQYSDITLHNENDTHFIGLKIICQYVKSELIDKSFFEVFS
jgi:uridine kinase